MAVATIFRREMTSYFVTPLAYVFIVIFLALASVFTFYPGGFFQRGQADLQPFFVWHPWLYLVLVPALGMRLWAEERKTGTIELLLTLPVSMFAAVMGKFLAAWGMVALSLALTFPLWITVNLLGSPDNGVIIASYLGSLLLAGAYLAIAAFASALTRNQVIAFVGAVVGCVAFLLLGLPGVLNALRGWLPEMLVQGVAYLGFSHHYDAIVKGVIDMSALAYFLSFTVIWLYLGAWVVNRRRAD